MGIKRSLPLSPPVPHPGSQEPPAKKPHRAPLLPTPESAGGTVSAGSTPAYIRQGRVNTHCKVCCNKLLILQVVEGHSVTFLVRGTTGHHVSTSHQGHTYQSVSEPPFLSRGLDQVTDNQTASISLVVYQVEHSTTLNSADVTHTRLQTKLCRGVFLLC